MESIQNWSLNSIHVALEEFVENLVGLGFDFLYFIDFIEDKGEEAYLIKKQLLVWMIFLVAWDFIVKIIFLYMSFDVGSEMQLGLVFIQGSNLI